MGRRLFVVQDTLAIQGRGLVLIPGILPEADECFRVGDPILLRKPDGSAITTQIDALELMCSNPHGAVVVMLKKFDKDDVPVGTEVWSVANAE